MQQVGEDILLAKKGSVMSNVKTVAQNGDTHPYVEQRPEIANGKPIIVGTRIKVTQIALETERLGWTPDQIVDAHPHLSLAQVHGALSYYYAHQPELDAELIAEEQEVASLRQRYPSKVATLHVR
jgi:uncharacterized protein (DUF433 family)